MRELQGLALARLLPRVRDIRRLGSCALDLCPVAEGRLDGYFEEGVNLWDHAAGGLVAQSAGARTEALAGAGGATSWSVRPVTVSTSSALPSWTPGSPRDGIAART